LSKLARIYFTSRGPATVKDFAWWSGLSMGDAIAATKSLEDGFTNENAGPNTYWYKDLPSRFDSKLSGGFLLPAYDEFLISYKDRNAVLPFAHLKKTISDNGLFRPMIVINGQVVGLWSRNFNRDFLEMEFYFFKPASKVLKGKLRQAIELFGLFYEKETRIFSR